VIAVSPDTNAWVDDGKYPGADTSTLYNPSSNGSKITQPTAVPWELFVIFAVTGTVRS
jgi:hypothetical protein